MALGKLRVFVYESLTFTECLEIASTTSLNGYTAMTYY